MFFFLLDVKEVYSVNNLLKKREKKMTLNSTHCYAQITLISDTLRPCLPVMSGNSSVIGILWEGLQGLSHNFIIFLENKAMSISFYTPKYCYKYWGP